MGRERKGKMRGGKGRVMESKKFLKIDPALVEIIIPENTAQHSQLLPRDGSARLNKFRF